MFDFLYPITLLLYRVNDLWNLTSSLTIIIKLVELYGRIWYPIFINLSNIICIYICTKVQKLTGSYNLFCNYFL